MGTLLSNFTDKLRFVKRKKLAKVVQLVSGKALTPTQFLTTSLHYKERSTKILRVINKKSLNQTGSEGRHPTEDEKSQ